MKKELRVHMDFYLTLQEGETKENAEIRFQELMSKLDKVDNQESAYQVYDTEIQEC